LFLFGFAPKGEEATSIYLQMVFGLPTHSSNERNLKDIDIDDNLKD
jgi:hypothetical protein